VRSRIVSVLTVTTAACLAVTACSSSSTSTNNNKRSSGGTSGGGSVIKIAIVPPSTGALAVFGTDAANGWQYAVDQANAAGGIDGHKVQLIKEDTDGVVATTLRSVRQAVQQQGASFIGGIVTSQENLAVNQQLSGLKALNLNSIGQDDSFSGSACSQNAFHLVQSDSMNVAAMAQAVKNLPGKKWALMNVDAANSRTAAGVFAKALKADGKQVVSDQFAPQNTSDFGSYITKLKASGADSLFTSEDGSDAVSFINQATQFKVFDTIKNVMGFNTLLEPLFPVFGTKVLGFYDNVEYDAAGSNALNTAFVAGYTKKYRTAPYYVPATNYNAAEALFAAIKKAKSTDPAKVRTALAGLTYNSIFGPLTMRAADHQLLLPTYVGQIVSKGKGIAYKITATLPASVTTPSPDPACKI
jgi:branched-chain amino acid transport system substrate-binding protein